jgi:thymidylate kinase
MRGIIVEGVTASGKSTILRSLQQRLAIERPTTTKLILSEHYTERVLEDARASHTLTHNKTLQHITELVSTIEQINSWKVNGKFADISGNSEIIVLVERFYGAHVANLESLGVSVPQTILQSLATLYDRLASIGMSIAILTVQPELLPAAVADTRGNRNQEWSNYLDSIGDREAINAHFLNWQERLVSFYATLGSHAKITTRSFCTSTRTLPALSDELFQLL